MRGLSLSFARKYAVKVITLAKQVISERNALRFTMIAAHIKADLSSIHAKKGMPATSHTSVRLAVQWIHKKHYNEGTGLSVRGDSAASRTSVCPPESVMVPH